MLTRIRDNLSVILAVAACVFAAYAYITNLHYNVLKERMLTIESQSVHIQETNSRQSKVIDELTRQRAIDDHILELLAAQQSTIENQGKSVRLKLEELAKNDQRIRDLFDSRLPAASVRLLLEQADPGYYGDENSDPGTSKTFNIPLPNTVN